MLTVKGSQFTTGYTQSTQVYVCTERDNRRGTVHSSVIQTVVKCSALRSMAQMERNTSWKLEYLVSQYGAHVFCILNNNLYCKLCNVGITSAKIKECNVQRHVGTMKHKQREQGNVQKDPMSNSIFYENMCNAFIPADIPFNKLANTAFREFLQKYTRREIPHQTTLRKYYVEKIYNTGITEIRVAANGVAQSVKSLACRSEVALGLITWLDFFRGFPQPFRSRFIVD
ncbi:hypothetical protein ANN_18815 [Periplaneta americana]|uniref:Uncharacterized protein n=1 Tax=Periplaneta americana TaxID=6978 RepID=A0ABQ8SRY0_PERAM|nr:hypothetical protein ANN_18815 [Periplaneta americana]